MSILDAVIALACRVHTGQVDKSGKPYILHPLRLMLKFETLDEQVVSVLHDVVELINWAGALSALSAFGKEGFHRCINNAFDAFALVIHGTGIARVEVQPAACIDIAVTTGVNIERGTRDVDLATGIELQHALSTDQPNLRSCLDQVLGVDTVALGPADMQSIVSQHRAQAVIADSDRLVVIYGAVAVVTHPMAFVIFYGNILITLRVDIELLGAFFVLHAYFVEVGG